MPPNRSKTVQSVDRAIALLRTLATSPQSLSLAELASRCELARPTAWRLLWTLEVGGLVEKVEPAHYRLAIGWTGPQQPDHRVDVLARLSRPVLTELAQECGVTASLVLVGRFDLAYIDQVDGPLFTSPTWEGPLSLHASSPGKAVLAALPDAEWRAMAGPELEELTETTITDLDDLAAELAVVRERGYARCLGEDVTYSNGASAVVLAGGRPVAAVDLWGPDRRVPESRLAELGAAAASGAARIQSLLP